MPSRVSVTRLLLRAVCLLIPSATAFGCSCPDPPPPCESVGRAGLVFLGTVTTIEQADFKLATMHVDRVYRGQLKETVELFDDGTCDGPDLKVAGQYLMYTSQIPGGEIPARGCSRSRAVEYATEDLDYLEKYSAGKFTTSVYGTVRLDRQEPPTRDPRPPLPMKDVDVVLRRAGDEIRTRTDAEGGYEFSDLAPGDFKISFELDGYRTPQYLDDAVKLSPHGCVERSVFLSVDRRVHGTVRDRAGEPLSGALVRMIARDPKIEPWMYRLLVAETDEFGKYELLNIPEGDYYLGINIDSAPRKERPYAPMYYPGVSDVREAVSLFFGSGASVREADLFVGPALPLVVVHGRLVGPDGKGILPAQGPEVRITDSDLGGQIETETIEVSPEGEFQIELCEGVTYGAWAFLQQKMTLKTSAPIRFLARGGNFKIELKIDKTYEEFLKLIGE